MSRFERRDHAQFNRHSFAAREQGSENSAGKTVHTILDETTRRRLNRELKESSANDLMRKIGLSSCFRVYTIVNGGRAPLDDIERVRAYFAPEGIPA